MDPRLLQRSRPVAVLLSALVVVGTLTAVVIVATAWVLSHAVADTVQTQTVTAARAAVPALVVLLLLRAGLAWATPALSARATTSVKSRLRDEMMTATLGGPAHRAPGPVVVGLTKGLDALDSYVGRYLPQLALAVTVPVVVGLAVLSQDLLSTVIIAVTLPLVPLFMILVGWTTQRLTERSWRRQSRLAQHLSDLLLGLRTLQLFGRAQSQLESLRRTEADHRRETMATLRLAFLSALVLELLATLSVAVVAVTVGLRVVSGDLDLATGLFVLIIAPEVYLPLRRVGSAYHDAADGTAALDAAYELGLPSTGSTGTTGSDSARSPGRDGPGSSGAVALELRSVTFAYPGTDRAVLRDLDLSVGTGELVVVAGPSGSGKSTVLDLVLGFVEPGAGTVSRPAAAQVAWLGQQPGLLTGSIADNLRVAAPDADDHTLRDALARAAAGDLDPRRQVGERGELLSAGELRRVGLARALLRLDQLPPGAGLLVLDEPTAGLDAETEARVLLRVLGDARRAGHGALVVSHRPAVLAAADRVVTLGPDAWAVAA